MPSNDVPPLNSDDDIIELTEVIEEGPGLSRSDSAAARSEGVDRRHIRG